MVVTHLDYEKTYGQYLVNMGHKECALQTEIHVDESYRDALINGFSKGVKYFVFNIDNEVMIHDVTSGVCRYKLGYIESNTGFIITKVSFNTDLSPDFFTNTTRIRIVLDLAEALMGLKTDFSVH